MLGSFGPSSLPEEEKEKYGFFLTKNLTKQYPKHVTEMHIPSSEVPPLFLPLSAHLKHPLLGVVLGEVGTPGNKVNLAGI